MKSPQPKPREVPSIDRAPVRDLCPVLRAMRLRIQSRLAAADAEILTLALPIALGVDKLASLQRERAVLVQALELIATASDRSLEREARVRWLEALRDSAPDCVTPKARRRLSLLIEGLRETATP
jgi:hypothetical protein